MCVEGAREAGVSVCVRLAERKFRMARWIPCDGFRLRNGSGVRGYDFTP